MANIIYGVAGEGYGHSTRSQLVGQRLIEAGHNVMFAASQKALKHLGQYFPDRTKEVFGLLFGYKGGRVSNFKTFRINLFRLPAGMKINSKLYKNHFENFNPDLVITDFEPFSAKWAKRNNVPVISIDNEHLLTLCKFDSVDVGRFTKFSSKFVTKHYYTNPISYIILSFFNTDLKSDIACIAPPILRSAALEMTVTAGEHVVLYSTTGAKAEQVAEVCKKFPSQTFHIYGFNVAKEDGNCIFKEHSAEGFLVDMASSRGVISSAGFSLITECLHFKKKMFLLPLPCQYEQTINAHYIEKLGLGISAKSFDGESLKRFLDDLDRPIPMDDERIIWPSNEKFFNCLKQQFEKLSLPVEI